MQDNDNKKPTEIRTLFTLERITPETHVLLLQYGVNIVFEWDISTSSLRDLEIVVALYEVKPNKGYYILRGVTLAIVKEEYILTINGAVFGFNKEAMMSLKNLKLRK